MIRFAATIVVIGSLLALPGCGSSGSSTESSAGRTMITIQRATYGGNCGAQQGNDTSRVAVTCNGKSDCTYVVDFQVIGDPAPGCAKAYDVAYICSSDPNANQSGRIEPEAGDRKSVTLRCR